MTLEKDEILSQLRGKKLILAVSGGVDSVVLLDLLAENQPVVAHVDHGLRKDSEWTARFVKKLTIGYELDFETTNLRLGKASEETAREARYNFLNRVKEKHSADYIVTAHHQDDLIETMVFNVLRGTGRRGLAPMASRADIKRPLLSYKKSELYDYAVRSNLEWLEDETNRDTKFKRNEIRLVTLPKLRKLHPKIDDKLFSIYLKQLKLNTEIDALLMPLADQVFNSDQVFRDDYRALDASLRKELILRYMRTGQVNMQNISRADVERIDDFIVNAKPAKMFSPTKQAEFRTTKDTVKIKINSD